MNYPLGKAIEVSNWFFLFILKKASWTCPELFINELVQ